MGTIGFVGLGRMGGAMAARLVAAGHRVIGADPSAEARAAAVAAGIEARGDLSFGAEVQVVLSSLPGTKEAEEVYRGGLLESLPLGSLCADLSTIDVTASRGIADHARVLGHEFLDCPVSGTSIHARLGTLVVMAGGDSQALGRARPILSAFSKAVHHLGPNGAGLEMKLITNRLLTSHLVAIAEAIGEMGGADLDVEAGIELLAQGAVPRLLDYKAVPMARRDHTPLFTVDLMSKDLGLARRRRDPGPVGEAAEAVMLAAREAGWGPSDISAVIEVLISERVEAPEKAD